MPFFFPPNKICNGIKLMLLFSPLSPQTTLRSRSLFLSDSLGLSISTSLPLTKLRLTQRPKDIARCRRSRPAAAEKVDTVSTASDVGDEDVQTTEWWQRKSSLLARRPRNGSGRGVPVRRNGIVVVVFEEEASAARISGRHFNAATAGFYDSADFKWSVRSRNLLARRPRGRSAGRD